MKEDALISAVIDRRAFLRNATGAMAASVLPSARQPNRPNVVLMICDDLGYGDLGCYGSNLPTPNLDRMATEGVRFTNHNSAHPICSASRAALLTGRYAPRSHTSGAYMPNSPKGMDLQQQTPGNLFRNVGYRTQAIGKWHLGDAPDYAPTSRGFDHYFGVMVSDDMQPLPLYGDAHILEPEADREELASPFFRERCVLLCTAALKSMCSTSVTPTAQS